MKIAFLQIILCVLIFSANLCAQAINSSAPADEFLGIKLHPEISLIIKEVENKTGEEIYKEFVRQKEYQFGSSFISEDGVPVVLIDLSLKNNPKKLEAVIVHELLHLRLRVNNYPAFLFSPSIQTMKGRAIDVEQSNINDLRNMIEHRVFKSEMEKFGLYEAINLAGDTATQAKKQKGKVDGQTDAINYARAILEYQTAKDVEELRKIYTTNGWLRSIKTGQEIANIISLPKPQNPKDVESVFLKCLFKLYPPSNSKYTFSLTIDRANKFFRQLIVNVVVK